MAKGQIFHKLAERQEEMRARMTGSGEMKRTKKQCPMCLLEHYEEVPDKCWIEGLNTKSDYLHSEFAKYLVENKKGRIIT